MHLQAPIHMVAHRVYTAHVVFLTEPRRVAVRAQEYGAPAMKDAFNKARDSLARHYRYGVNFATKVQALAAFPDVWAASASPKAMAVRARPPPIAFHTNRLPAFCIIHAPAPCKHRNCRPPPPPPFAPARCRADVAFCTPARAAREERRRRQRKAECVRPAGGGGMDGEPGRELLRERAAAEGAEAVRTPRGATFYPVLARRAPFPRLC